MASGGELEQPCVCREPLPRTWLATEVEGLESGAMRGYGLERRLREESAIVEVERTQLRASCDEGAHAGVGQLLAIGNRQGAELRTTLGHREKRRVGEVVLSTLITSEHAGLPGRGAPPAAECRGRFLHAEVEQSEPRAAGRETDDCLVVNGTGALRVESRQARAMRGESAHGDGANLAAEAHVERSKVWACLRERCDARVGHVRANPQVEERKLGAAGGKCMEGRVSHVRVTLQLQRGQL
mmetsp:Transcript_23134/g.68076  ORF Transcript_23134/g.68076 Transcript_23134/m.68076 type:complete len:241 (+) Transcript_23134:302-1024(+)